MGVDCNEMGEAKRVLQLLKLRELVLESKARVTTHVNPTSLDSYYSAPYYTLRKLLPNCTEANRFVNAFGILTRPSTRILTDTSGYCNLGNCPASPAT